MVFSNFHIFIPAVPQFLVLRKFLFISEVFLMELEKCDNICSARAMICCRGIRWSFEPEREIFGKSIKKCYKMLLKCVLMGLQKCRAVPICWSFEPVRKVFKSAYWCFFGRISVDSSQKRYRNVSTSPGLSSDNSYRTRVAKKRRY